MKEEQKILLIILDGLGDRPIDSFTGQTPLEAARTPVLNLLAEKGTLGLIDVEGVGVRPGSDTSYLSLLGYDPREYYFGRGPFEALGAGINMNPGDVAFRVNFATLDKKGKVADRRAGRIEKCNELAKALEKIKSEVKFSIKATREHRGALVFKGKGISPNITTNDSKNTGVKPLEIKPTDETPEAKNTASIANDFLSQANKLLDKHPENKKRQKNRLQPANYLLLRGAGSYHPLPSIKERYGLTSATIAGDSLYKGIAIATGMDVVEVRGATGAGDTNLLAKTLTAKNTLLTHDFVVLHIKGTDDFGHDGDAMGKKAFIERVDAALTELANIDNTIIALTGDHSTPCALKNHSGDAVPLLINGRGVRVDSIQKFGERDAAKGGMGRIRGLDLMPELLNLAGRAKMYGT